MAIPSSNLDQARNNFLASLSGLLGNGQYTAPSLPSTVDFQQPSLGMQVQLPTLSAADFGQKPAAPPAPDTGTLGKGMFGVGDLLSHWILNPLDNILGKPISSAEALLGGSLSNIGHMMNGTPYDPAQGWNAAKAVWNGDRNAGGKMLNEGLGLGFLNQDQKHFAFSPGNLGDLALGMFAPGGLLNGAKEAALAAKEGIAAKNAASAAGTVTNGDYPIPDPANQFAPKDYPTAQPQAAAPEMAAAAQGNNLPAVSPMQYLDNYLSQASGAKASGAIPLQPTSPGTEVDNVVQGVGNNILKNTTQRNVIDGEWSPIQELQALMDGKPSQYSSPLDILTGGSSARTQAARNVVDGEFTPAGDLYKELGLPDPGNLGLPEGISPVIPNDIADALRANPNMMNDRIRSQLLTDALKNGAVGLDAKAAQEIPNITEDPEAMRLFQQHQTSNLEKTLNAFGFGSGINGIHPELRNAILNGLADLQNGSSKIGETFSNLAAETHANGLADTLESARNQFETTGKVDHATIQKLTELLQNGVEGASGSMEELKNLGIAPDELRQNYIPLTMKNDGLFTKIKNKLQGREYRQPPQSATGEMNLNRKLTGQTYNMGREFETAANARAAGYHVDNAITSTAKTLLNRHVDASRLKLMHQINDLGGRTGDVMQTATNGYKLFKSKDAMNPLNGKYLSPSLHRFLTTHFERTPWARANIPVISPTLQAYDRFANLLRSATLYTPTGHLHNVFGNAMLGFGLHPNTYLEAERALSGKVTSPEMKKSMEWAKKTGALGNDHGSDMAKQIERSLKGKNAEGAYSRLQDATLWDREKALRLGVFHDSFEGARAAGMTEEQAANVARDATNRHMIDYSQNNLSTFEREVMSRLDPYYKWHKGNYPLQFRRLGNLGAVGRMAGAMNTLNNIQSNATGHDMQHNIGGLKEQMKLQLPLGNDNYVSFDPYLPFQEPMKMMADSTPNFLFNRLNPLLKEAWNQSSNSSMYPSPSVAPEDKKYLSSDKYAISNQADSAGQQMLSRLQHALQSTYMPENQPLTSLIQAAQGGEVSDRQVPPVTKLLLSLMGGFPSTSATSQNKIAAQDYLERQYLANQELNKLGGNATTADRKQIARKYDLKTVH